MQQRIRSLLALSQLTALVVARNTATQQMFAHTSYNAQEPRYPSVSHPAYGQQPSAYGQQPMPMASEYALANSGSALAELNNQQLVKELLPFITLPSMSTGVRGQQLGVVEAECVDWSALEQELLDQAFPAAADAEVISLTDKVLVINSRTSPIRYTLENLTHINWSTELGNQLPYTFTVMDLPTVV